MGTVLRTLFPQRFCGQRCVTHCRPWALFWGPSHIDRGTNECIFIHFCNGFGWKRNCCKNALRIVSARSQSDLAKLAAMVLNAYDAATLRAADTSHQCVSEWAAHAATSPFLHTVWSAMAHLNHGFSGSMFWSRKRPSFWTPGVQNGTRIGTRNQAHETKVFPDKK